MSKIGLLRTALLDLLREHERDQMLPTSARFLFYELVQRGVISKERTGARRPDQDLNDALTDLRESGEVPWNWIVDETRSMEDHRGASSVKDWLLEMLQVATLDPWAGREALVLTESRSLAGVLRNVASEYRVRIAPTNGQCSGFLHTDVGPRLRLFHQVLYLGDYDLAGNDIEANTRRVHVKRREEDKRKKIERILRRARP